ncbi:DsbA family protein [Ferrimonas futtsuensis]|uniref:DsbA family protein n=1 Tax=Ferrimonas futtsuensis TaxID=364764 RepID=UPI0004105BC5|nr:thioredoxin domain-containing protein [Ferrimonas futtsuensis]
MNDTTHRTLSITVALLGGIWLLSLWSSWAWSEEAPKQQEHAALVEQITREVIRELKESGQLKEEVDQGIQEYFDQQRQARAEAREQRAKLAQERAKLVRPPTPGRDHFYGNPDAPISLIEYSDFECPFCKRFHATARQLVDQSNGQINWVYRHCPLGSHNPGAQKQAEASECAFELGGDSAFWRFTDAIYLRTKSGGQGFALEGLTPLAEEIGLNKVRFQECLDSGRHAHRVLEDFNEVAKIGITGTPGNILRHNASGEVIQVSGAKPLGELKQHVQVLVGQTQLLSQQGAAAPNSPEARKQE